MGVNGSNVEYREIRRNEGEIMDAEARMARKAAAKDRKYSSRYKPKQVGKSVFTIQQVQAKRAEQGTDGRVKKPSRSHVFTERVFHF